MVRAQRISEELVFTSLNFGAGHDGDGTAERRSQEEVRLGKFAAEDENPKRDRGDASRARECWVRSSERLGRQILSRFASYTIPEHPAGRNAAEGDRYYDGNEKLHDADDERDLRLVALAVDHGDVERGANCQTQNDEEKNEPCGEVRGVVPGCWDVGELCNGSEDHDDRRDASTKCDSRPSHLLGRIRLGTRGIDFWRIESCVEVIHRNVQNPDTVEIDNEMSEGSLFIVGLEEDPVPSNAAEFREALSGRNIDETYLVPV